MWDCTAAAGDRWYIQSNPSEECFGNFDVTLRIYDNGWEQHAGISLILVLVCTYIPFKLYDNLKYELFISEHSKLDHEKNMGFLYLKYKPEYWYWEPVVEMSRKWLLIFFSTFLPSGELQAIADIVIILVYWGLHARYLPFRTDWKDEDGNPADPDLENNLQHCMYAIQLLIIIVIFAHSSYEDDPNVGGAVLLVFYFLGIVFLGYAIGRSMLRHDARIKDIENKDDKENIELSTLSKMLRKVFDGVH